LFRYRTLANIINSITQRNALQMHHLNA